jgi:hypothetical protein
VDFYPEDVRVKTAGLFNFFNRYADVVNVFYFHQHLLSGKAKGLAFVIMHRYYCPIPEQKAFIIFLDGPGFSRRPGFNARREFHPSG